MPIIASLIARGPIVLAECCPQGNNFSIIARRLIEQIPSTPNSKKSYSYENYNFHYLVEGGITFICMTDQSMEYRITYAFLFDINERFKGTFGEKIYTATNMALNDSFSRVLLERMEYFSNNKNADKILKVKSEIEDAKNIMVKNIVKVLESGAKIEVLVDKTETLHDQSQSFKRKGTKLKRKMWWKNTKLCFIIICIAVIIITIAVILALWYSGVFSNIFKKNDNSSSSSSGSSGINSGSSGFSSSMSGSSGSSGISGSSASGSSGPPLSSTSPSSGISSSSFSGSSGSSNPFEYDFKM
jgi:vesicle-associated membrane protein 7